MPAPLNPGRGHGAIGPQTPNLPWNGRRVPFGRFPRSTPFSSPQLVRVSQEALETLYKTSAAQARVSQQALEVLSTPPTTSGNRLSQLALELITTPPHGNLVSQDAIEVDYTQAGTLNRISQDVVEALYELAGTQNRISQNVVEVLMLGGAPTPGKTVAGVPLFLGTIFGPVGSSKLITLSKHATRSTGTVPGNVVSQVGVEVLTNLF